MPLHVERSPNDFSKTADNALRLLLVIADAGPIPTVQLAQRSSLHRSVVRRLVNTLAHHRLIWATPEGYVVGSRVLALAEQVAPQLQDVLRPLMRSLADDLGETVLCTMRQGTEAVLLCQERGLQHLIRVEDEPGSRRPLHIGASGATILSMLSDDEIDQALAGASVGEASRAREHVAATRRHGYCRSAGEHQPGVAGLAVPVSSPTGDDLCSLSVIVPEIRAQHLDQYAETLVAHARRAESLLSSEPAAFRGSGAG